MKKHHHVETPAAVNERVAQLQSEFASGDAQTKLRLLAPAHAKDRFENYDPDAAWLSEADARLLIANQQGYAYWNKYASYLHLDPAVQTVIQAVRAGDLPTLQETLHADPSAANPKWVSDFEAPAQIPNDSIPLFCVSEGSFRGTNPSGNEYELSRALTDAGADVDIDGGLPLASAVSFGTLRAVEALLDGGAMVDGVDRDGVPMAYAMLFAFSAIAELLADRGAKLDLRFAAGLGHLELVKSWFEPDGSLKSGAGALADPYGLEHKRRGEPPFRCERSRENILSQALYFACVNGKLEVAEFLLSKGAAINAIVPGLDVRATVLHRMATMDAASHGVIRFLLERGADPKIRDQEYHATAVEWARYNKRPEAAELLGP